MMKRYDKERIKIRKARQMPNPNCVQYRDTSLFQLVFHLQVYKSRCVTPVMREKRLNCLYKMTMKLIAE